jgi:hypothetical protein
MRHYPTSVFTACEDAGFTTWLRNATAGQMVEYHRGFLVLDADLRLSELPETERMDLTRLARRAYSAAEQRLVHLVQRRLASGQFSYLAIMRRGARGSAELLPVLLECAA